ncbi:MAG TPA: class I SAM-dependent methyltransferase [Alcaligenes faecalis]|nr:class I SAM-dependent methyltransferase [Alcaligenes faecalis]
MTHSTVLVFPFHQEEALDFIQTATRLGLPVVRASSEVYGDRGQDGTVHYLPYVNESEFDARLADLIAAQNISQIYTMHPMIWHKINRMIVMGELQGIRLCSEDPLKAYCAPYEKAMAWAQGCGALIDEAFEPLHQPLSNVEYAHLYSGAFSIPGQSDSGKIELLTRIARHAPKGDVVEIGSAYGRSAFALAVLARAYALGNVVCVDPWGFEASQDQGSSAAMVNADMKKVDWQRVFEVFRIATAGFDNLAYIRQMSKDALADYQRGCKNQGLPRDGKAALGVLGEISILHIDGNHKYELVKQDIDLWTPYVKRGGWVLIDDYEWTFGDGPKRAGDEFLKNCSHRAAFVSGDTLCIQLM